MGLSSSQGRLLSITARLTSNEYETQQLSNAKMRLTTQSQQASAEYINALNTKKLTYTTYDEHGDAVTQDLTAGVLYQYRDMKNQYVLENLSGQTLISQEDASHFKNSGNLDEFLQSYGINKEWKSEILEQNYNTLQTDEYKQYKKAWEDKIQEAKSATYTYTDSDGIEKELSSDRMWEIEKYAANEKYMQALSDYNKAETKYSNGYEVENMEEIVKNLNSAKEEYTACLTYQNWLENKATYEIKEEADGTTHKEFTEEYLNIAKYNEVIAEFNTEAENYGPNLEDLFTYTDSGKAQWYKNLWYKLNGTSSEKSKDADSKYEVLDSKLLHSSSWLKDALTQGIISVEIVSNEDIADTIVQDNPTISNLQGISWKSIIYTSCTEITQEDDDQAIARAEAEYERKTKEISVKDNKYERKIKLLDTEHNALQTEYESVQSAMNKNIERSFKVFS